MSGFMDDESMPRAAESYWVADGSPDFGYVDDLPFLTDPAPIRLFEGNQEWGAKHIRAGHGAWLKQQRKTVPEMLWMKCGQNATIHGSRRKCVFHFKLNPNALLVLRYFPAINIFSVVTLYGYNRGGYSGEAIAGRYNGQPRPAKMPQFSLFTPPPIAVMVKKAIATANPLIDEEGKEREAKPRRTGTLSLKGANDPPETE